jgi:hypothetical protein
MRGANFEVQPRAHAQRIGIGDVLGPAASALMAVQGCPQCLFSRIVESRHPESRRDQPWPIPPVLLDAAPRSLTRETHIGLMFHFAAKDPFLLSLLVGPWILAVVLEASRRIDAGNCWDEISRKDHVRIAVP